MQIVYLRKLASCQRTYLFAALPWLIAQPQKFGDFGQGEAYLFRPSHECAAVESPRRPATCKMHVRLRSKIGELGREVLSN